MKKLSCQVIGILLSSTMLVSCATIVGKSSPELLNIRSTPEQASVVINDEAGIKVFEGKTPTSLSLEKKKGYFQGKKYTVKIVKDGYVDHVTTADTTIGGWYLGGNLLFGGLVGWLIVDPATGAMWTLDTNEINATLSPKQALLDLSKPSIVSLENVPPALKDKMVKISE